MQPVKKAEHYPPCTRPGIVVLFCDLGNVLVTFEPRAEWLWKMAKLYGPTHSLGDLEDVRKRLFFERLAQAGVLDLAQKVEAMFEGPDTGRISAEQVYTGFLSAAEVTRDRVPPERFWAAYDAHLHVVPETCRIVQDIQSSGVLLVAASNGNAWLAPDLIALSGRIRWDAVILSWQVGARKPNRGFYDVCRARAEDLLHKSLTFSQCLLIDDSTANVEAFRRLGGHAIQFEASGRRTILAIRLSELMRQLAEVGL